MSLVSLLIAHISSPYTPGCTHTSCSHFSINSFRPQMYEHMDCLSHDAGLTNPGAFAIGDTLCTGSVVHFLPIPTFP